MDTVITEGYLAVACYPQETTSKAFAEYDRARDWLAYHFSCRSRFGEAEQTADQAMIVDNTDDRTIDEWVGPAVQIVAAINASTRAHITEVTRHPQADWNSALTAVGFEDVQLSGDLSVGYVLFSYEGARWALADDNSGETSALLLSRNIYRSPGCVVPDGDESSEDEPFYPVYGITPAQIAQRAMEILVDLTDVDRNASTHIRSVDPENPEWAAELEQRTGVTNVCLHSELAGQYATFDYRSISWLLEGDLGGDTSALLLLKDYKLTYDYGPETPAAEIRLHRIFAPTIPAAVSTGISIINELVA